MCKWHLYRTYLSAGMLCVVLFPTAAAGQLLVGDYSYGINEYKLDGSAGGISFSATSSPSGMAFGQGTDLFVVSQSSGSVLRYNWLTESYLGSFDSGLVGLGGVLYDNASNTVYATEFNSYTGHRIAEINATTGAQIGTLDVGTSMDLSHMALGTDGSLYVSGFWDGNVYKGSATGGFSALPAAQGSLSGTSGLVFDAAGNLDVVGMLTFNVFQFNSGGAAVGDLISATGGLSFPSDIVVDPDGNLLVSNMGDWNQNGFIGKYATDGSVVNAALITVPAKPTAMLVEPAVWTGGAAGINGWKNADNWRGTPPTYPLPIIFGAVAGGHTANSNDYDPGTQFKGITFIAGASHYSLQGNAIKLGGPVVNQSSSDQEIDVAMELVNGGGTFDTGDQKLTIIGAISGDGSLVKKGAGTLALNGSLTYAGATNIQAGTLQIDTGVSTSLGDISGAGTLGIGSGTTLIADSVAVNTLTLASGSTLVISAVAGGPSAVGGITTVPEPGAAAMLLAGGLLFPFLFWRGGAVRD
jgi:autotransporter-associated beta strand protein